MTRQEAIQHWKFVVQSVYVAEDRIKDKLDEIDKSDLSPEDKAEKWLEMVAEEVLKSTTDEEFEKMGEI